MARQIAARSLRTLLARSLDFAGVFPPASQPVAAAVDSYNEHSRGEYSWLLRRFVLTPEYLAHPAIGSLAGPNSGDEPIGCIALASDEDHLQASSIETKTVVSFGKPTYCEVNQARLPDVLCVGSFAKIRTGGVTPESIPSVDTVAGFIKACAQTKLAFKATAGLHHPIRSMQPLTYQLNAPRANVHGFINFFVASAFAWKGTNIDTLCRVLEETDPDAFRFADTEALWRDHALSLSDLGEARRECIHSFGSCSFADPIDGLQELGWL